MVFCHHLSVCHDFFDSKCFQIVYKQNVCNSSRADRTYHMVNAICFCAIDRRHLDCSHRFHSCLDCQTYYIVQMSFFQNITCCHIICTEADSSCKCRIYLCHCSDILCQEMCYGRLADQHVHSFSHLLYNFLMIIALMIQTHTRTQISVQIIPSCHWRASEYRKTILKCFCNCSQCVFVFFLDKLSYCLPYSVTLRPFLYLFMYLFCKVKCYSRLRNCIWCLIRCSPEHFQRTRLYLLLYFLQSFQT